MTNDYVWSTCLECREPVVPDQEFCSQCGIELRRIRERIDRKKHLPDDRILAQGMRKLFVAPPVNVKIKYVEDSINSRLQKLREVPEKLSWWQRWKKRRRKHKLVKQKYREEKRKRKAERKRLLKKFTKIPSMSEPINPMPIMIPRSGQQMWVRTETSDNAENIKPGQLVIADSAGTVKPYYDGPSDRVIGITTASSTSDSDDELIKMIPL